MIFREALISDIPQLQVIRNSVKENVLSDPRRITVKDYEEYLAKRGKGWVCEGGNEIVGFAVVDLEENNIWALFVRPEYEGRGIGKRLHEMMLHWYFRQKQDTLWLSTAFNTRAEKFYRRRGWITAGNHGTNEVKLEITFVNWKINQ